jgi:choline dehydrogenase-like flavoprotein
MTKSHSADVLIVGAGPSGGVVARYLAEHGVDVLALEQGDWVDSAEFPAKRPEIELLITRDWNPNPNVRQLPSDYPIDASASDVVPMVYNGVGGGTILFGGAWHRALPSDFEVRTRDGVADDWPISYADLEPYYAQTFRWFGVSGHPGDPAYPPHQGPPNPALPLGDGGLMMARAMSERGWHWWPASQAIASRNTAGLGICRGWGTCGSGCPEHAKASADLAVWKPAVAAGARLVTGARVRKVTTSASGLATGAHFVERDGAEHHVKASVVVLAANGIGTPRLLMLSSSTDAPDGLANSSGLVGRNLMMHPYMAIRGSFDEPIESWMGPWGNRLYSLQFYETDQSRGFVRGAKWSLNSTAGPLFALSGYDYDLVGGGSGSHPWGPAHHDYVRTRVGHSISWDVIVDDLPEEANRVELHPTLTDSDGIPSPAVIYKDSQNTEQLIAFHTARAVESLEAAGARVIDPMRVHACGWHILGTTRMGDDPARSVVDSFGRAHDVNNLFIVDGGTFVTSTGVNPTATIAALALRSAEHILATRQSTKAPS